MFFARCMHQRCLKGLVVMALASLVMSGCGGDSQEQQGEGTAAVGQVTVLYEDDAIKPENQDAVDQTRESGVLEQLADWSNERLALPYGIEVRVTDDVPQGVEDRVTQPDGRTIFVPGAWLTETHDILTKIVEDLNSEQGGPPPCFPRRSSTPTTSTC